MDLTHVRRIRAEKGENGKGKDKYGRGGQDERVRVPVGTIVRDRETGEIVGELLNHGQELVVARGGQGGRGNKHFATPTDRAPRKFEPGQPGEARDVELELQVMADVGLLGFPNVGKSTFVATVSRARPKIADYPFTTLVPQLGVVRLEDFGISGRSEDFVVADIPGLIPEPARGGPGHPVLAPCRAYARPFASGHSRSSGGARSLGRLPDHPPRCRAVRCGAGESGRSWWC